MTPSNPSHVIFDQALIDRRRARAFAHAGGDVSKLEFLLDRAAQDIVWRVRAANRRFATAANLGAHHGLLSRALRPLPSVGMMIDVESCWPLLRASDGPRVQAALDVLPFGDASLDLAVSALSLHWVNDLPGTLVQIRRALKPDGLFLGTLLGGLTLWELRDAMLGAETEVEGGASPRVAPFADVRDLGSLLQRAHFALPVVDADAVCVTYSDPLALMREIKAMGGANPLHARRRKPLRRATLMRAAEIYRERHGLANGRIPATFELVALTGWAPHENQQKPLRPGSATARLADALGAVERPAGDTVPSKMAKPGG